MFCPECHAEYRQGFTHCADCDVDLVYQLPPEARSARASPGSVGFDDPHGERQLIWRGNKQSWCVSTCRRLLNSGIPYRVAQIPEGPGFGMPPAHRYEIGVARSDYQRAKDLLGFDGEFGDATYNREEDDATDAPFDVRSFVAEHLPPDPEIRKDSYLEHWYPEDAIVEVWSQDGDDISAAIAMALKENLIHFRIDLQDGVRKVFVLSEDESRARQIVREIVEGI